MSVTQKFWVSPSGVPVYFSMADEHVVHLPMTVLDDGWVRAGCFKHEWYFQFKTVTQGTYDYLKSQLKFILVIDEVAVINYQDFSQGFSVNSYETLNRILQVMDDALRSKDV